MLCVLAQADARRKVIFDNKADDGSLEREQKQWEIFSNGFAIFLHRSCCEFRMLCSASNESATAIATTTAAAAMYTQIDLQMLAECQQWTKCAMNSNASLL